MKALRGLVVFLDPLLWWEVAVISSALIQLMLVPLPLFVPDRWEMWRHERGDGGWVFVDGREMMVTAGQWTGRGELRDDGRWSIRWFDGLGVLRAQGEYWFEERDGRRQLAGVYRYTDSRRDVAERYVKK